MKEDVLAQVAVITAQDNVEPDLAVNVTCTKEEARDYLLLNSTATQKKTGNQVEAEDEQEVADEIAELVAEGNGAIVFEHEIALQSCTDCDMDEA